MLPKNVGKLISLKYQIFRWKWVSERRASFGILTKAESLI
jgi:hypothetical protein